VKEFVLRLIHLHRECDIEHLDSFFGFSERELSIVIRDLHESGLISISDSNLTLTQKAEEQFSISSDGLPRLAVVENWLEKFAIDFISFSLINWEYRPDSYRVFHELESSEHDKVSRSRDIAKDVLAGSFYEYLDRFKSSIDPDERTEISIYGISTIEPGDNFTFPLKVDITLDLSDPTQINFEYPDFQSEADQAKRQALVSSVSRKIKDLLDDSQLKGNPYEVLVKQLDVPFFRKHSHGTDLKLDGILKSLSEQDQYSGHPDDTRIIVGGFANKKNRDTFFELMSDIDLSSETMRLSNTVYSSKPTNGFWLRDPGSVSFISDLLSRIGQARGERPEIHLFFSNRFERSHVLDKRLRLGNNRRIFPKGFSTLFSDEMASSEVLIVPDVIGAMSFYFYSSEFEFPVPVGFITKDTQKLQTLSEWVFKEWAGYGRKVTEEWCSKINPKRPEARQVSGKEVLASLTQSKKKRSTLKLRN
jgi:hypothetical protein